MQVANPVAGLRESVRDLRRSHSEGQKSDGAVAQKTKARFPGPSFCFKRRGSLDGSRLPDHHLLA
ncbi:MAG TPA: hypothetical protein VFF96_10480, partial [Pseudoxanthomonas sp.]|nr:hypothetical protein [Pseudoxanthomonas sp.]